MSGSVWAYKVTYHVLTLPINNTDAHMVADVNGKRLEAVRAIVDNATTIELPAHFKSPLATNFKYYKADQVDKTAAMNLHSGSDRVKGIIYNIKGELTITEDDDQTPVVEGTAVDANMDIYVTYEYVGNDNSIVKLDGSKNYNIGVTKGFLAYNRGRNNRPAVIPKDLVSDAQLISEDFVKVDVSSTDINPYWSSGDNKNPQSSVGSHFHFLFKFEGNDPYNIIIRTAYNRDSTYMEKEGNNVLHFKYYKEGSIFAPSTNNCYIASDEHKEYSNIYDPSDYPTYASFPVGGLTWTDTPGFFHRQNGPIWSAFALLNNTTDNGYVFMGSRTYDSGGAFSNPGGSNNNYQYKYLKFDNANLTINNQTPANATANYSVDQKFYAIKTVTFKVVTPYGNTVSASVKMSEYKIANDAISVNDIPTSLERKYCSFTRFYNDAAHTQEITKYSEMTGDDIYVAYEVSANVPFSAITPADAYDANTWKAATWYELTDDGSTEESGKKLKYDDAANFKNNGAHNEFTKKSEYAFMGDPYELRVVYRNATSDNTPWYVGVAGADPASGTALTLSTTVTAGYQWEIPDDNTTGSFLLRKYNGTGHWSWDTGNRITSLTYGTSKTESSPLTCDEQTVTVNISGLTYAAGNYIKVTKGGTHNGQVTETTPVLSSGISYVESDGTATVTATIAANSSEGDKIFTLTIQEYNSGNSTVGTATTITFTQGTTAFAGNTVEYSTTASTRVKVLELSSSKYTYNIVDKAGRIAAKATTTQPIYSPLSIATIPSIILSPFIASETVRFYDSYTDRNSDGSIDRKDFSGQTAITEAPESSNPDESVNIYVTYTTAGLQSMPFRLNEEQEIFVKLNGEYIYYDAGTGTIKSSPTSQDNDNYKWKLRNRDPYAMLIDNLGARTALSVTGKESVTAYADDGGTSTVEREKGAWVKLPTTVADGVALNFTATRGDAQMFIAKSSTRAGVYEVMVATGDVDASETYYNIGRPDNATVSIYSNATYKAGVAEEIKFRLEENTLYTYHLIDKAKKELLTATSKSPELVLPAEWQSPLVGTYHYYDVDQFNISEGVHTLKSSPTELTNISSLLATYTTTSSDAATYNAASNKMEVASVGDIEPQTKKLTATGHYYFRVGDDYYDVEVTKPYYTDIYVTYVKNDLVNFNDTKSPYLLKFLLPLEEGYYLEDGADKLTTEKHKAVYPYCNGDGNLNIYWQEMNTEQMEGGSTTRPRWVWFFDCPNNYPDDPYHVTVHSKNKINSHPTYLETYAVHFNQDTDPDTKHIVTGGTLPGAAETDPTEYMVLGTEGNYRLVTSKEIEGERRTVNSFEQYWKTYNMIKLYVLGISNQTNAYSDDPATFVVPDDKRSELLALQPEWHSYEVIANATRWNGYNDVPTGLEKKKVEKLEHWFQTLDMGDGSFDIISASIPPVLVLLDRHGWEIMRKPLPTTNYPNGEELEALRAYDSPMVKEYYFFSQASKASGCHKYTLRVQNNALRDAIKIKGSGTPYTSTSLADLPPKDATGVVSSGEFNDQFVTYTVKEEYENSYTYELASDSLTETATASKFLVLQNGRFLKNENQADKPSYISKPIYEHTNLEGGNVYDLILTPKDNTVNVLDGTRTKLSDNNFFYVKPNLDIDREMGLKWGTANSGAEPLSEKGTKVLYNNKTKEAFMMTTGFDPYNLQLQNVGTGKYLTSHITSTKLESGAMVGDYSGEGGNGDITLEDGVSLADVDPTVTTGSEGYDHTNIKMTNQTFMAVQDEKGNMQLVPRFDQTKRVNTDKTSPYYTTLADPVTHSQTASADNNASMGPQTTFMVRPQIQEYIIIDNEGCEALRYKRAGDTYPVIPNHFKSPLAKDFTYYKTAPAYDSSSKTLTLEDQITGSFAKAGLNGNNATVYVRYDYDADYDADGDRILQGKWFTMSLAGKNVKADGTLVTVDDPDTESTDEKGTGISLLADNTKPATINADAKEWQWKFHESPFDESSALYKAPDPYAVRIFNRQANYSTDLSESSPMCVAIKVNGTDRFALLSHPSGGYALAADGLGTYNYTFLNGENMTTGVAATTAVESNFTSKANGMSDTNSQLILNNDVTHNYTYNIINNSGTLAAHDTQTSEEASGHDFAPYVPESIQTPLLDEDEDYLYYGNVTIDEKETPGDEYTVVPVSSLRTIYGLYDDVVYVRYKAFDRDETPFFVPNVRNATNTGTVEVAGNSNDVAFDITGNLPYNIIWLSDNMMSASSDAISDGGSHALSGDDANVWKFEGSDPYAINIKSNLGKYVDGTGTLSETPKNFMLLKHDGYDYGVLAETGNQTNMLSGYGQTTITSGAPSKYIIFALSVYKLIYQLVINNTGTNVVIPYRKGDEYSHNEVGWKKYAEASPDTIMIPGTTQRDLEKYPVTDHDAGQVSLGDVLEVPGSFYRPNCKFLYYIAGIYEENGLTPIEEYDNRYKGLRVTKLMSDADLIGRTVKVNVAYSFDTTLETNAGDGFVKNVADNFWYTIESNDGTPWLMRFNYGNGAVTAMQGRDPHYTNDFLWSPLGDPYGFRMYNRYVYKNGREPSFVLTTKTTPADGLSLDIESKDDATYAENSVYELTDADTPGFFIIRPMANNNVALYNNGGTMTLSSSNATEWTFGLNETLLRPYYDRAGYVGGLTAAGKTAYDKAKGNLQTIQQIVYNDANIVQFTPGYYRLSSMPNADGITTPRYLSGYTHAIEKDLDKDGDEADAIPMHFYSRKGVSATFEGDDDGLGSGFTVSNATRGDLPILATEYDPSTVFYMSGSADGTTMQTQGLNVIGNKMGKGTGTSFRVSDIGGAVVLLNDADASPGSRQYLYYNGTTATRYDVGYSTMSSSIVDKSKWCIEMADSTGLEVTMNFGGDEYYYSTFYAPFDVLLPADASGNTYYAYVCTEWDNVNLHPTKVPASGVYAAGKFVPAGTPVILRTTDRTEHIKLSLPSTSPSSALSTELLGTYLEQLLPVDASHDVYTFGLPFTSEVSIDRSDGSITAELPTQATSGVAFYINANRNKECNALESMWFRNNRYVLHNKIYYRGTGDGGAVAKAAQFVPVNFDFEDEPIVENDPEEGAMTSTGSTVKTELQGVYDMMGRKIVSAEEMANGQWQKQLAPGLYIINGRKVSVK